MGSGDQPRGAKSRWKSPGLPPALELRDFRAGPPTEFDGTLRGAVQLWRETGRAQRRSDRWRAASMTAPVGGSPEAIREAERMLRSVAAAEGLQVVDDWPSAPGATAQLVPEERLVLVAPDLDDGQRMASLAHELGHWLDPWLQRWFGAYDQRHDEADIEIVAQMAASVFGSWHGLDMSGQTDGYLASWRRQSKARKDGRVGELLERASIAGLSMLPQDDPEVAAELARARARLRYRNKTYGMLGRFWRKPEVERELGIVDCSDW